MRQLGKARLKQLNAQKAEMTRAGQQLEGQPANHGRLMRPCHCASPIARTGATAWAKVQLVLEGRVGVCAAQVWCSAWAVELAAMPDAISADLISAWRGGGFCVLWSDSLGSEDG